jgi:two-component system chemotaxis response regulator CheB
MLEVLADPDIDNVGEADDGKCGIELRQQLRPDVVTLDMVMPVMNGLAATGIHHGSPSNTDSHRVRRPTGEICSRPTEVLAAGALDAASTSLGAETNSSDDVWEKKSVATVKLISRIRVTHPRARLGR